MGAEPAPWDAGPRAPWVQVDTEDHAFLCLRCATREPFRVPVQLDHWTWLAQVFVGAHQRCPRPERAVETVQGSLLEASS
jgi:hypothetical protein